MPVLEYTGEYTLKAGEGFDASTINGKSVVITGGASGIGKEIVKAFIPAGASFVTIGDLQESGQQLADELGDRVAFVKTDVTKWADQVNLFQAALIRSPSHLIDTVISNAGISGRDSLYWDGQWSFGKLR
jgi:NAD(P)-dependent dehydrogenase (short-subunit alcohol dehydrogenase family)